MSDKNLLQLQAAKETTWGTPVTPYTVKYMLIDDAKITPIADTQRITELRGSMAPAYVTTLLKLGAQGNLKGTVTYEDAPYWLESLLGVVAPTGTGPYVYAYSAPLTAIAAAPRVQTLAFGDSVDGAYQIPGAIGTKLNYSVKNADQLLWNMDFIGKQVNSGATLAALSDRTVTPVMASDFTVYIDNWGGTIGTTALAANVYSLDLTLDTKRDLRYYLGALTPGRFREPMQWDFTLKLVLEFVAAAPNTKAYLDAILALGAGSVFQKQVRLKATQGASAIWQIDLAGTNEKAPTVWTYDNNVQTLDLELKGQYNSALANYLKASVTSGVASLV